MSASSSSMLPTSRGPAQVEDDRSSFEEQQSVEQDHQIQDSHVQDPHAEDSHVEDSYDEESYVDNTPSDPEDRNTPRLELKFVTETQTSTVFERTDVSHILKKGKNKTKNILDEYRWHREILLHFERQDSFCRSILIPKIIMPPILTDDKKWHRQNRKSFPEFAREPGNIHVVERIPPIPFAAQKFLIKEYNDSVRRTPKKKITFDANCLVALCLGKTESHSSQVSRSDRLVITANLARELGLPVDAIATALGEFLAHLHYGAKTDGFGIEFVLGGAPDNEADREAALKFSIGEIDNVYLWVLDFDQCARVYRDKRLWKKETSSLVRTDYLPKTPKDLKGKAKSHKNDDEDVDDEEEKAQLWEIFKDKYVTTSEALAVGKLQTSRVIAERVVDAVEQIAANRLTLNRRGGPKMKWDGAETVKKGGKRAVNEEGDDDDDVIAEGAAGPKGSKRLRR